jgi:hypothetical protein
MAFSLNLQLAAKPQLGSDLWQISSTRRAWRDVFVHFLAEAEKNYRMLSGFVEKRPRHRAKRPEIGIVRRSRIGLGQCRRVDLLDGDDRHHARFLTTRKAPIRKGKSRTNC